MRKLFKMVKQCMVFCFVVILTINSFAAVVSGDDGGAFLTKQSFEEMKAEFEDKIDNYNISLDNKIDGAIAAYLAGLPLNKDTTKQNLGIYRVPLDIYMNFKDVDNDGFSSWGPKQTWRIFIGYYSAYITGDVTIDAPKNARGTATWQPKQWYNLEKEDGELFCSGGYKTVNNNLKYAIWGLSDTGLGASWGGSGEGSHCYMFAANLRNLSSSVRLDPRKYWEYDMPSNSRICIKTGDDMWNTGTTDAPSVNGFTTVKDDLTASSYYITYTSNESSGGSNTLGLNNVSWVSGFHSVLHSTQAATQEENYVNAITNNKDDYVHVLYDGEVRYSVRGDKIYGKGSLGSRVQAEAAARLGELRTSSRQANSTDRYVWAFAVPYFTLIKEGWNKFATEISFDSAHYENTSLIKASHVTQKYKGLGEDGSDLVLGVSEGLYLCTPEKTADIELTIDIDTTDLAPGDRPYILINSKAIDKTTLSGNLRNEGFKKIEGGTIISDTYGDYAKYLNDGENVLTIKECDKNQPVIMKILWSQASDKKVVLKKAVTMELDTENY